MVIIQSYLKWGAEFVSVTDHNVPVHDSQYVDGAIELTINDKPVLTTRLWDLVDQLWAYIVSGLTELVQGNAFRTYFPDQPVLLSFDPIAGDQVKITVQGTTKAVAVVPVYEFVDALTAAGELFFQKMIQLNPAAEAGYTGELAAIKKIRDQMVHLAILD